MTSYLHRWITELGGLTIANTDKGVVDNAVAPVDPGLAVLSTRVCRQASRRQVHLQESIEGWVKHRQQNAPHSPEHQATLLTKGTRVRGFKGQVLKMVALKQTVVATILIFFIASTQYAVVRAVFDDVVGVVVAYTSPEETALVGALRKRQ